jgi:hypothetical protein
LNNGQYMGGQTRSFTFSTLSRLSSAKHPEMCQEQQGQCVPAAVAYTWREKKPSLNIRVKEQLQLVF